MNTSRLNRASEDGNFILVALILSAICGLTLGSYLIMAQQQNTSIYRSQTWNGAMAISEAGIEDGLQMINVLAGRYVEISKWTNYATANGWDQNGNIYHVRRTLNGNSYDVWITNQFLSDRLVGPTISCLGNMPWTFSSLSPGAQQVLFAQTGPTMIPSQLARKVWVRTRRDPLFTVAMAAIETIDLKGNNIRTDSFDSSSTNTSINGLYPTGHPEMTGDSGDVCTDSALVDSLNVGNADIKGHIRTGPGVGTYTVGANGSVGSSAWVDGGNVGIQPGWASTDFNILFPQAELPPDASWLNAAPTTTGVDDTVDGVQYQFIFRESGDYYISSTLSGNVGNIYVGTNANVRLRINKDINSSTIVIRLSPEEAYLQLYMVGSTFNLSGSAYIDNASGHPDRFYFFGLPTCTSISFGGNGNFYGCVYAPNAAYQLGGGGNNTWDFVGSSVTRSVSMNGHFNFHFDTNLRYVGPAKAYVVNYWEEIAAN